MIKVGRRDLLELAKLVVVANTPVSLYEGLRDTSFVRRLVSFRSAPQIREYYDRITARGRRTEIELGLAYSLLLAFLLHPDGVVGAIDPTRLRWGPQFAEYARLRESATQSFVISGAPEPTVETQFSPSTTQALSPAPQRVTTTWTGRS